MKPSSLFLAVVASLIACQPAPPPPPPAPDAAAIHKALDTEMAKFGPALKSKDPVALSAMFTEDGVWILPDATTFTGRAAIEAGAKAFLGMFEAVDLTGATIDRLIVVSETEAVTFVHANFSMTEKGKQPVTHINAFADHWKKGTDGVWRVAYEVNAEGPAPKQ